MLDTQGRNWIRETESLMVCEDGHRVAVLTTSTDAEALEAVNGWVANQQSITVPQIVEMAQARLALLQSGLLAGVDAAIDAMPDPQRSAAKIEWEFRATVRRDSQLVQNLGAALQLTDPQIDALFASAAKL